MDLIPRKTVIAITIILSKFCNLEFRYSPKTEALLATQNKKITMTGNKIPLAICANFMISMGFIFREEKKMLNITIEFQNFKNEMAHFFPKAIKPKVSYSRILLRPRCKRLLFPDQ